MPTEFKLPELGENITSGDVLRVIVAVGDVVERDQPVIELETDKATIEVPSSVGGKVTEVKVKAGDKVNVGQTILVVDEGAAASPESQAASAPAREAPGVPPQQGSPNAEPREGIEEQVPDGGLSQHTGSRPEHHGSDKPGTADKPAPAAPPPESEEEPDTERPRRGRRGEVVDIRDAARQAPAEAPAARPAGPAAPAAPSVRRLARELGVDIDDVRGTGPDGRISMDDVKAHAKMLIVRAAPVQVAGNRAPAPLPDFTKWGEVERKPMSGIRRKTAEHLTIAWTTIPHVTQHERADITALDETRKRFTKRVEEAGGALTVTSIVLKVVAAALKVFPQLNASVDMASEEIIFKKYVNIGVAVDTDHGLLVPVIRDVDQKNLIDVSVELTRAAERARTRKITLDEMQGGGFSISNLGAIGGTGFSPIINSPEVAVLGLSRAALQPLFVNGQFQARLMLPLSLLYDHRVVDGADALRFLRWVIDALEQPFFLSFEG